MSTRMGELVIGAPGCGKSTYCNGMAQFLNSAGRETVVVNLDPGNDLLPYECAVDVMELIRLEDAMDEFDLGPNGGLVYCMEYIEQNLDWHQIDLLDLVQRVIAPQHDIFLREYLLSVRLRSLRVYLIFP